MKLGAEQRDKRNKKIRKMWRSRLYTKAEIGRKVGLCLERIRQLLEGVNVKQPYLSDDFDWKVVSDLRKLLRIPVKKSTHTILERQIGIYRQPRVSIVTIEYIVYILESVSEKLTELQKLLDELKLPT